MEENGAWKAEKVFDTNGDPLVNDLKEKTHPCFNCHVVHEGIKDVEILEWIKNLEQSTAGNVMDAVPDLLRKFQERGGIDLPIAEEELRQQVGEGLSRSLDKLDEDLAEAKKALAELVESCEGTVSVSTQRNNRLFGVIACGSAMLPDSDYSTETVHITRYTND